MTRTGYAIGGGSIRRNTRGWPLLLGIILIPASEVSVERLFDVGRDVLGVLRFSIKAEAMRILMLLDGVYKH
jgi:hypothetical protein